MKLPFQKGTVLRKCVKEKNVFCFEQARLMKF